MTNTILFAEAENGYSKAQVDSYVEKLSKAYRAAYTDNQELQRKYDELVEESKTPEGQERTRICADIATKTMRNMETLAQKIVAEAQEEALRVKMEAQTTIDEARAEAARIRASVEALIGEAAKETAKAKEDAWIIRKEARAEAADIVSQALANAGEAQEIMRQTYARLKALLIDGEPEGKGIEAA
ncbi:MAG: DivIVA domain-containing protein [Clostridiales bacterium]|nr:DivIVA domain-containing protein [Clostridiales bacterium]